MKQRRVMVDMSATIIHYGHIRILKKAAEIGIVVVGLTVDEDIIKRKGYQPELEYNYRKEVLEAIKYVDEVVETPWLITQEILDKYEIDLLLHGDDNSNLINKSYLKVVPRTEGVSSSEIRQNYLRSITQINNQKLMLTPGPAVVLHENIQYIKPLFGRGDDEYQCISEAVLSKIKQLSGQDKIVMAQGSSSFALELSAHTFLSGKILLISTGYYSDRLEKLLPQSCNVTLCKYQDINSISGNYDWVMCAYTETSIAFKVDLQKIRDKANNVGAKLYVDATGSIGLENHHELADVMAFSSCKGLFGLTGACFVAYKNGLDEKQQNSFYNNLETHKNKMVTGPYHAIASLYAGMQKHDLFKQRVIKSKQAVLNMWPDKVRSSNQPLLCTYIEGKLNKQDNNIVLYTPRSELSGSVLCHLGEIHSDNIEIVNRVKVTSC
jgi:cytidyltransferase-like protein